VVVAGDNLATRTCHSELPTSSPRLKYPDAASGRSFSRVAKSLGLCDFAFSTTLSAFTLDLLANNSPPWPASPAGEEETAPNDPHPPADIEMNPHSPSSPLGHSTASSAKWFGLLGAILLLVRASCRR
jgi:membrane-associated phospholipid phosphatase